MEQTQMNGQGGMTSSKPPVLVKVIAWIMLIYAVIILIATVPVLFLGGLAGSASIAGLGGIGLVRGIGLIIVAIGLMKTRRWALYVYTVLTVLAIIGAVLSRSGKDIVDLIINVVILVYLWSISKRFN